MGYQPILEDPQRHETKVSLRKRSVPVAKDLDKILRLWSTEAVSGLARPKWPNFIQCTRKQNERNYLFIFSSSTLF